RPEWRARRPASDRLASACVRTPRSRTGNARSRAVAAPPSVGAYRNPKPGLAGEDERTVILPVFHGYGVATRRGAGPSAFARALWQVGQRYACPSLFSSRGGAVVSCQLYNVAVSASSPAPS